MYRWVPELVPNGTSSCPMDCDTSVFRHPPRNNSRGRKTALRKRMCTFSLSHRLKDYTTNFSRDNCFCVWLSSFNFAGTGCGASCAKREIAQHGHGHGHGTVGTSRAAVTNLSSSNVFLFISINQPPQAW